MTDKQLAFLGLGTIVEVDDMDALEHTKYVVVARAIGQDSNGETILRYMLAPHPYGHVPDQKENILRITASQITKIIHEGYTDELDTKLLDDLEDVMRGTLTQVVSGTKAEVDEKSDSDEKVKQVTPLVGQEPKLAAAQKLEEENILKRDPFYKFRKMKEEKVNGRTD
ncbi:hypothetical protein RU86_GL001662 [Lactococcus piscium]|uniref:DUF4176 domain-containing protein n=1 Tax=Pseudolactococcus piscium TaxID=1364 RepID=A0A2A5RUF0_9LACT|nr:DUF4176 domain-containing protein [Lactococcus piscium]PCS04067.1 hypothetical protein RU86_GL001662 [Lactococcus piscium]